VSWRIPEAFSFDFSRLAVWQAMEKNGKKLWQVSHDQEEGQTTKIVLSVCHPILHFSLLTTLHDRTGRAGSVSAIGSPQDNG
jgi:hypothetical protein